MTYLDAIIERKKLEVADLRQPPRLFDALDCGQGLAVIAEIKRRSPSNGKLAEISDPLVLARKYIEGGAHALSILTDDAGFGGTLNDLRKVADAFPHIPILRKDFIIDLRQVQQTARSGATAILLIVAALGSQLAEFIQEAQKFHLDPVVEVHDLQELKIALDAKACIIGVNNRNLNTFDVDLNTGIGLVQSIPPECIKIAESGIRSKSDAAKMAKAGFDAVLVGEALVKSDYPQSLIQEFCQCH